MGVILVEVTDLDMHNDPKSLDDDANIFRLVFLEVEELADEQVPWLSDSIQWTLSPPEEAMVRGFSFYFPPLFLSLRSLLTSSKLVAI